MAVCLRAGNFERLSNGAQDLATQDSTHRFDLRGVQIRQICQCALANAGALTVGLAQENSGRSTSVGNDVNVHAHNNTSFQLIKQHKYMPTKTNTKKSISRIGRAHV